MKFIHLTDMHIIGDGLLYGQDPAARLRTDVASISTEHGDAGFVVLTGDMTHSGDAAANARFCRPLIAVFPMTRLCGAKTFPVQPMFRLWK